MVAKAGRAFLFDSAIRARVGTELRRGECTSGGRRPARGFEIPRPQRLVNPLDRLLLEGAEGADVADAVPWRLLPRLAALGFVPPWLAALGMSLSSLAVVLNARRLATPGDGA